MISETEREGIDRLYRQRTEAKPGYERCLMNSNEIWK